MNVSVLGLAMRSRLLGKRNTVGISQSLNYEINTFQCKQPLISHPHWPGVKPIIVQAKGRLKNRDLHKPLLFMRTSNSRFNIQMHANMVRGIWTTETIRNYNSDLFFYKIYIWWNNMAKHLVKLLYHQYPWWQYPECLTQKIHMNVLKGSKWLVIVLNVFHQRNKKLFLNSV